MRTLLLIFLISMLPLVAAAEPAPPAPAATVEPLALARAVRLALETHPRLEAARRRLAGARFRHSGAGTQPNPELVLAAVSGTASESANSLNQRLEIAGQPGLRAGSAEQEARASEEELAAAERDLALQVVEAWVDLWEARQGLTASLELLALDEGLLRVVEERQRVGDLALREVLPVRVDRDLARQEAVEAERAEHQARASLNTLLSRQPQDPVGDLSLLDPLEGLPPLEELLAGALARRPELAAARARLRAQELRAVLTGRQRAPDLVFSLYQSRFFTSDYERGASVSLVMPLFDYGQIASEEAAQREEMAGLGAWARELQLEVERQVSDSWHEAKAGEERVRILAQSTRPDARRAVDMNRRAFTAGYATYLEVVTAQRALRQVQIQEAAARAQMVRARARLEVAAGWGPAEMLRFLGVEEEKP